MSLASQSDTIDFFGLDIGFLVLLVEFFEKFVGGLSGSVELGILFLKNDLHCFDISCGLGELVETLDNILLFLINGSILSLIELRVGLDEGKIGLGSDIDISTHLLEVNFTDFVHHLVHFTHVDRKLLLCLSFAINLKVVYEL